MRHEGDGDGNRGLMLIAAGLAVVVLAVLMIGLTTATGALDWVSVVTAGAGLVMIAEGMYLILRTRGAGGTPPGGQT